MTIEAANRTSEETGKQRILATIRKDIKPNGWPKKPVDIEALSKEVGVNTHEVEHLLHSLKKDNLLTFREGHNRYPIRLRLTPKAMGGTLENGRAVTPDEIAAMRKDRSEGMVTSSLMAKYGRSEPTIIRYTRDVKINKQEVGKTIEVETITAEQFEEEVEVPIEEAHEPLTFPITAALARRKETLLDAAKLAESGGADEIALALIEKADIPLTPQEQEAVTLYQLYTNSVIDAKVIEPDYHEMGQRQLAQELRFAIDKRRIARVRELQLENPIGSKSAHVLNNLGPERVKWLKTLEYVSK